MGYNREFLNITYVDSININLTRVDWSCLQQQWENMGYIMIYNQRYFYHFIGILSMGISMEYNIGI